MFFQFGYIFSFSSISPSSSPSVREGVERGASSASVACVIFGGEHTETFTSRYQCVRAFSVWSLAHDAPENLVDDLIRHRGSEVRVFSNWASPSKGILVSRVMSRGLLTNWAGLPER